MDGLTAAVDGLAVYRLTRVVTKDTVTQTWRDRIIRWAYERGGVPAATFAEDIPGQGTIQQIAEADLEQGEAATASGLVPRLAVLFVCRWCASVWLAAVVVAARWVVPVEWGPVAYGLAVAAVAGLLPGLEQ